MSDELNKLQVRALQYWYVDGIFEFGFGLLCLVLAIYMYFSNMLHGNRFAFLMDVLLVVVVIGGSFLMNRLVKKWKEHVTFPRTGYVSYPRKGNRGRVILMGMLVAGALGVMVFFLSRVDIQVSAGPLVAGIFFGSLMILVGWRNSLRRFYLHAVLSLLAGIGLAFSSWGNYVGLATFYLVISLILLASGIFNLYKYLRQNPLPPKEVRNGK